MLANNGNGAGEIPIHHRLSPPPEALRQLKVFNQRIHDAGLKTQNYDKGLDMFIRKFKPEQEISAIVAIA
jgi:hypothetical protein